MVTRTQAQAATTKIVWGACPKFWKNGNPQFAKTKSVGEAIAGYYPSDVRDERQTRKVEVTFSNPADNDVVEAVAAKLKMNIDWACESYAQKVANESRLRNALRRRGYDAYMDRCVFENAEPVQIVVFTREQASVL